MPAASHMVDHNLHNVPTLGSRTASQDEVCVVTEVSTFLIIIRLALLSNVCNYLHVEIVWEL